MPERGDHPLVIALAEARDSSLADAVARRHAWGERIGAALAGDSFNTSWSAFWSAVDALDRSATDRAASVGVLLLVSCRHIYASGRAFAQPHPVAPRLLPVARQVIDGFNAAGLPFTGDIEREIGDAVSRSVHDNLARHPEQFVTVVGPLPWTFDGWHMTFDAVARVYVGDLLPRIHTSAGFESLRQVFLCAADHHSRTAFTEMVAPQIARAWPQVRDELRATWVQRVERVVDRSEERGSGFVELFGPARADADWLAEARRGVEDALHGNSRHGLSSDAQTRLARWCEQLTLFDGALHGGRSLLDILRSREIDKETITTTVEIVDAAWRTWGPEDVAFLPSLLFVERQLWAFKRETGVHEFPKAKRWEGVVQETRSRGHGEDCLWLVERLAELPTGRRYNVREYRSDERAAWRADVTRRLARKPVLRRAALEFLLWWSEGKAADDAELVALALVKDRKDRSALQKLAQHVSRTVQLRAHAVAALLDGHTGDAGTAEAARTESLAAVLAAVRGIAPPVDVARTWMGDSGIESLLHTTISRVERLFTVEYPMQWANEEERLVTRLLSALEHEFTTVRSLLRDAQVRELAQPVDIHLEYRESTKREEGQRGVGTPTFAVDIAFLVRLETAGAPTVERVTFVQVKKLEGAEGDATWKPSFHVPRDQMDDLIAQTEASFYLFLVPPFLREECWLVPARLVRNIMDLAGSQTALPRLAAGGASRSFAQWLTYDILGLWTGDERSELLKKGRGDHPGRRPRFIVTVTIRRGHENGQ